MTWLFDLAHEEAINLDCGKRIFSKYEYSEEKNRGKISVVLITQSNEEIYLIEFTFKGMNDGDEAIKSSEYAEKFLTFLYLEMQDKKPCISTKDWWNQYSY